MSFLIDHRSLYAFLFRSIRRQIFRMISFFHHRRLFAFLTTITKLFSSITGVLYKGAPPSKKNPHEHTKEGKCAEEEEEQTMLEMIEFHREVISFFFSSYLINDKMIVSQSLNSTEKEEDERMTPI